MKVVTFLTHNDKEFNHQGSSWKQGTLTARYSDIVNALGEPHESDGYKSDAGWDVLCDDGTFATVYNWKNGKNYNGEFGQDVEDITEWSIGGTSMEAVLVINKIIFGSLK